MGMLVGGLGGGRAMGASIKVCRSRIRVTCIYIAELERDVAFVAGRRHVFSGRRSAAAHAGFAAFAARAQEADRLGADLKG